MTPLSENKIVFDWETMKFKGITISQAQLWESLYPRVNVVQEITINMVAWLDKVKGTKKANKRNWKTFIVNWLKREQEKRAWENARRQA
jgi:hypothetical protein